MPKKKEVVEDVVEETTKEVVEETTKKPKKDKVFEPFIAKVQGQKIKVVNLVNQKDGNIRLQAEDGCEYVGTKLEDNVLVS